MDTFKFSRELNNAQSYGREKNPCFNSALNLDVFKDMSLRRSLWAAKITKIGHLIPEGNGYQLEFLLKNWV